MGANQLNLLFGPGLRAYNAGLFVSRGHGIHPDRRINTYELIFVRQGTLGIEEEGVPLTVGRNQSLILWPGRRHRGIEPYGTDLSFYWIHFTIEERSFVTAKEAMSPPGLQIAQRLSVSRPEHLTELFRRFLEDQEAGSLDAVSGSLMVALILCEVNRSCPAAGSEFTRSAALAGRADVLIRTQFHRPLSSAILGSQLSRNPNYLNSVYRAVYGTTLTESIHQTRLRSARRQLMDEISNMDEISRACGFSSTGYFRRIFKRREGMTPAAFRELYARVHTNTE